MVQVGDQLSAQQQKLDNIMKSIERMREFRHRY